MQKYDIVIVGAGISGATLAERYAAQKNKKVLIIEKRDHIAGNCYDFINEADHMVSKYGAHLFHTNFEDVWEYVNRFSKWRPYEHRVLAKVDGQLVPIPVNITTVNKLFGLEIQNEAEMREWLEINQVKNDTPKNGEEAALARVGPVLYEKMFKHYTKKQWDKYPEELDASVLQRIPVRDTIDDRYFSDKYQALPAEGYTKMFEKILNHPNITVMLSTDYFDVKDQLQAAEKLFYTGPIDRFFEFKHSVEKSLQWRSIRFEWETLPQEEFQASAVINYPQPDDGEHTRIIEYKKIYPLSEGSSTESKAKTTICHEYSIDEGDPYYPVPNPENDAIFQRYKDEADTLKDIYFVGRLANYKYFNMDQAFKNALDLFAEIENTKPLPRFKSFIQAGFECTAALGENKRRLNLLGQTRHDVLCQQDYELIKQQGLLTVREGISWSQVDSGNGTNDYSRFEKMMQAAQQSGIQQVWDLNHFDYPHRLDPFSDEFITAFAEHARSVITIIRKYVPKDEPVYIVPVNEISFFAWIGSDMGWWAPYKKGRENGGRFKQQLVKAAIAAMDAIWELDSTVRFIQVDPFMRRVIKQPAQTSALTQSTSNSNTSGSSHFTADTPSPTVFPPSPKALEHVQEFNEVVRFEAWDILCGFKNPELGGDPKYLDIIGLNYYVHNQEWVITGENDSILHQLIDWDSEDRVSFADMISVVYERYHRPIFVSETGSFGARRGEWWTRTLAEIDEGLNMGLPIVGVCAYPILDRPESAGFLLPNSGIWDFDPTDSLCQRIPHEPSLTAIGYYHDRWRSLGLQT